MLKQLILKSVPAFSLRWLNKAGLFKNYKPAIGRVSMDDMDRVSPFCKEFGYNRGGPVDRYYIENFLKANKQIIKGRVLEIGDNEYTLKFGSGVTQSDILHVNTNNPIATIIGDLTSAPQIPDNTFDCVILTQTLHLIYDYKAALQTIQRILKPGGALLMTNPGITPIDQGDWKETWYWSFTDQAIKKLLSEYFIKEKIQVEPFGNVYAATTFLFGMGLPEVTIDKLKYNDPQFQVIITAVAEKESN